jgi:ribose transport system ATP-binding protein
MSAPPLLAFQDIGKSFAGVPVLRRVSFAVAAGRTLGLVGENGAGKSTLMNIVGGNLRPDAGVMSLDGQPFAPLDPSDAARHGISFIHQELNLFPNLAIDENIFLARFPVLPGRLLIDRRTLRSKAAELLAQVGLNLPPETLVERLSSGERQLVEIAKALSQDARLIILDEPTSSLSARETDMLFALMRRLRGRGIAMIFISHALGDVLQMCDDLVILRDGEVVGSGPRAGFTSERMISLMVGRSITQLFPPRDAKPAPEVALDVHRITQPNVVRDIAFRLHRGEVLGLAGLMGAGRSELARILFGLDPCASGEILLGGVPIAAASIKERIRAGLAFLTENRREEGLSMEASIQDNIALVSLGRHARPPLGFLNFRKLREAVDGIRRAVRLTATARNGQPAKILSGGNQQKVVLAKWLLAQPQVLILDEPTRGIDVGAKYEIYQLIGELAARGAGVLVISSELEELIGLCDRILVMRRGEITDRLDRPEFDRERILRAALGTAENM